jgi:hypothetical protein
MIVLDQTLFENEEDKGSSIPVGFMESGKIGKQLDRFYNIDILKKFVIVATSFGASYFGANFPITGSIELI